MYLSQMEPWRFFPWQSEGCEVLCVLCVYSLLNNSTGIAYLSMRSAKKGIKKDTNMQEWCKSWATDNALWHIPCGALAIHRSCAHLTFACVKSTLKYYKINFSSCIPSQPPSATRSKTWPRASEKEHSCTLCFPPNSSTSEDFPSV